jgi:hypothetical protein
VTRILTSPGGLVHRRTAAALVVAALAATPLTSAAPAEAATAVTVSSGVAFSYIKDASGCASTGADFSDSPDTPFGFDGTPVATSWNGSATLTKKSGDTGDQVALSAAARGTFVGRSVAGRPSSIDVDGTVTTTVTSSRANSACSSFTVGSVRLEGAVTLTAPTLVTIAVEPDAGVGVQAVAGPLRVTTGNLAGHQSGTVLVPVGELPILVDIAQQHAQPPAPLPSTWTGSAQVHITLTPPGSQTVPAAGKAASYVVMPAARSCATHEVLPAVVAKKKKAKQVLLVTYYVNGITVRKVKHPKKGSVVALPVADNEPAEVRAVVRMEKKKGKHRKELEVTASYAACSG